MANITITATCRRNIKGDLEDVVILVIAGREFVCRCNSPEQARAWAELTIKELGLCTK